MNSPYVLLYWGGATSFKGLNAHMKYILSFYLVTGLVLFLSPSAEAVESEAQKYQKCMTLAQSHKTEEAMQAVDYANDWIFGGHGGIAGGVPAKHCKALGLLAMGKAKQAAELLESLVDELVINGDPDPRLAVRNSQLKVELNLQAGLAWKEFEDYDNSYMAFSSAVAGITQKNFPNSQALLYELYLERGTLQNLRRQYKSAVEDFNLAIEKNDQQFEGFLQRAKAYRKRRKFLQARLDLKVAAIIEKDHPEILLESGILYREEGRKLDAKLAWQMIIDQAPDSEYAKLAQTNIELLVKK